MLRRRLRTILLPERWRSLPPLPPARPTRRSRRRWVSAFARSRLTWSGASVDMRSRRGPSSWRWRCGSTGSALAKECRPALGVGVIPDGPVPGKHDGAQARQARSFAIEGCDTYRSLSRRALTGLSERCGWRGTAPLLRPTSVRPGRPGRLEAAASLLDDVLYRREGCRFTPLIVQMGEGTTLGLEVDAPQNGAAP